MLGLADSFEDESLFPPDQTHLVILDDVFFQASNHPQVVKIFTQYRHHKNISDMMLTQNLFQQGKYSLAISLINNYMILFKKSERQDTDEYIGSANVPEKKAFFMEHIEDAVTEPYRYILVDLTPPCLEPYRPTTGVLDRQLAAGYLPKTDL